VDKLCCFFFLDALAEQAFLHPIPLTGAPNTKG
jgi:hypothetical protein